MRRSFVFAPLLWFTLAGCPTPPRPPLPGGLPPEYEAPRGYTPDRNIDGTPPAASSAPAAPAAREAPAAAPTPAPAAREAPAAAPTPAPLTPAAPAASEAPTATPPPPSPDASGNKT